MSYIAEEDIINTLVTEHGQYWKGQHVICITPKAVEDHMRSAHKNKIGNWLIVIMGHCTFVKCQHKFTSFLFISFPV